jgi:hypothetical protein
MEYRDAGIVQKWDSLVHSFYDIKFISVYKLLLDLINLNSIRIG